MLVVNQCGNDFETKTVYWIAIDAFQFKLKKIQMLKKIEQEKILIHILRYFPSTEECFFNNLEPKSSIRLVVGLIKNIIRTSD